MELMFVVCYMLFCFLCDVPAPHSYILFKGDLLPQYGIEIFKNNI